LDAFGAAELPDAALVVAGMPLDTASTKLLNDAAAAEPRIRLVLRFVPDEAVAELFAAADAAVLARGDGGTSGALILAISLGLPAVAAATPTYRELLNEGSAGWFFAPGD